MIEDDVNTLALCFSFLSKIDLSCNVGNPTYLPKAEAKCNNMINFVKMRMCESVINDLMEMKKSKYNLVDVAFIQVSVYLKTH